MPAKTKSLGRIADLLKRSGIDPDEIEKVREVSIKEWQGLYKDGDGEAHVVDMEGAALKLTPTWADGPKWPVVQQAKPTVIKTQNAKQVPPRTGVLQTVLLPDPQIGFRELHGGSLLPFHDERAMDVAMQVASTIKPNSIVNLGDFFDFAMLSSKFTRDPAFAFLTQNAIDRGHEFLAQQRQMLGSDGELVLLEGNHDLRLPLWIAENAAEAFSLTRANTPEEWPVMSVPHLTRLTELDCKYVDGYPAGVHWINDNLAVIHGNRASSVTGKTASNIVDDERVSIGYGHIHRIEQVTRTRGVKEGPKFSQAFSPGCLCRIDGAVPSTKSPKLAPRKHTPNYENWQQGMALVTHEPGDGWFSVEIIPIYEGNATFRGRRFASRVDLDRNPVN